MNSPRRPLDHRLVDAAQLRASRTRGSAAKLVRVVLVFNDGGRESIDVTDELRTAARRSRIEAEERDQVETLSLTKMERTCLQALAEADGPLTGDEVARKAGYQPGAAVGRAMSALQKKGCARRNGGYEATELGRRAVAK